MPTEVLIQLRALRDNIADTLRRDPRYQTLVALDRSIAEISRVLNDAGLNPAETSSTPALDVDTGLPPDDASAQPLSPLGQSPDAGEPKAASSGASSKIEGSALDAGRDVIPVPPPMRDEPERAPFLPMSDDQAPWPGAGPPATPHARPPSHAGFSAAEPPPSQMAAQEASPFRDKDGLDDTADLARWFGYTPMQAKPDAIRYQPAMSVKFGRLPNKVDLRPLMPPIDDQQGHSCVANAVAGAYEYWIKKSSKQELKTSRLFVYYNARWRDGTETLDAGCTIQFAMEGLVRFGACDDAFCPSHSDLMLHRPSAEAYQHAAPYAIHDMAQVPVKLEAWKQALAEGKPIIFGCTLFEPFDGCSTRGGVVAMPQPGEAAHLEHAFHCMCAVGYSDSERVFIVRNSWSSEWGDKGYCYIPFAYLMNPTFNDGDCWVFIPKVPSQPPRETWSDDTRPVINAGHGVDFRVEPYLVADYAKNAVDFFEPVRRPFNEAVSPDYIEFAALARRGAWDEMEDLDRQAFPPSFTGSLGIGDNRAPGLDDGFGGRLDYDDRMRDRWQL